MNTELAKRIIHLLNKNNPDEDFHLGKLKIDYFADGEILPLFNETIRDQNVYFIQTTTSSDSIMETLLVIDAAKRSGCKSFTLIAPFQGYSRQDKTDHLRSSIGSKMLADVFEKVGMTKLITIDLHASAIQGFYNIPVVHINGNKIFIEHIKENHIEDLTILAPDQGAVKRASDFTKAFPDSTFAMINKKRIKPNEIHSMELVGDVEGRNVVIVDDIVDTGGTLKKAAQLVMDSGAKSVRAIATHGILSGDGYKNIDESVLTELLISDSVTPPMTINGPVRKIKYVSCDRILARVMLLTKRKRSIHEINAI